MERVTITNQFHTVSVCCLCFLLTNLPFIENLLFYTAVLQDKILAVEPHHKLTVTWSQLKMSP